MIDQHINPDLIDCFRLVRYGGDLHSVNPIKLMKCNSICSELHIVVNNIAVSKQKSLKLPYKCTTET